MTRLRRRSPFRRALLPALLLAASVAAVWLHEAARPVYPHLIYVTGWTLFGFMLVLTAYNARKKLSFLPLLSSRTWFQIHVYLGLFTGLAFLAHIVWRVPRGPFEVLLALLFVGVTLSGVFGWWLSRSIPRRLTTAGGEVPYERIPVVRRDLRLRAEKLVLTGIPGAKATTLADFYAARLTLFFAGPANLAAHLAGSRRPLTDLLEELAEIQRFLGPDEKVAAAELADLIRRKDALDLHRAGQLLLKGWLFVHIPLTYALLLFTLVHIVLVYAFSGGVR